MGSSDSLNSKSPLSNVVSGRTTNASNVPSALEINFWPVSPLYLVLAKDVWPTMIKSLPIFSTWESASQLVILSITSIVVFDVYPLLFGLESPETKSEVEISDEERKVLGSCTVASR